MMSSSTRAAFFGAIAGSALWAGLGQALASEPANLGNFLPGNTMGAPIAAERRLRPRVQGALQRRGRDRQFDVVYGMEISRS
jgi:hypothetical protein